MGKTYNGRAATRSRGKWQQHHRFWRGSCPPQSRPSARAGGTPPARRRRRTRRRTLCPTGSCGRPGRDTDRKNGPRTGAIAPGTPDRASALTPARLLLPPSLTHSLFPELCIASGSRSPPPSSDTHRWPRSSAIPQPSPVRTREAPQRTQRRHRRARKRSMWPAVSACAPQRTHNALCGAATSTSQCGRHG